MNMSSSITSKSTPKKFFASVLKSIKAGTKTTTPTPK